MIIRTPGNHESTLVSSKYVFIALNGERNVNLNKLYNIGKRCLKYLFYPDNRTQSFIFRLSNLIEMIEYRYLLNTPMSKQLLIRV